MKYILEHIITYEASNFYSFESEKSKEELKEELIQHFDSGAELFYGHNLQFSKRDIKYTFFSELEEYWKFYLPNKS